jgi:hypothetical protein
MNWLIGSKFQTGQCSLCGVVHCSDVSDELDASVVAVWFISHEMVNAADFATISVEIYQTTRRHSAKDSSLLRINNTDYE